MSSMTSALGRLLEGFRPYLKLLANRQLGIDLQPKCDQSVLVLNNVPPAVFEASRNAASSVKSL